MTEDIGSDRHKHPSSAEIDVAERLAVLRERIRQSAARDVTMSAQMDIIISKLSKIETGMALGEKRFESLEDGHEDTTEALTGINGRVDAIEKNQASVTHKIVGGGMVITFLLALAAFVKDWIFTGKVGGQ